MNYLIDTHILLWYIIGDNRINKEIQNTIEKKSNTIYFSNASLWEIAIKISIGKLKLHGTILDLEEFLHKMHIKILQFDFEDFETLQKLPFFHQDPFDRLIVAQAKTKSLNLISNDSQISKYFS